MTTLQALFTAALALLGAWLLVLRSRAIPLSERYRRVEWYATADESPEAQR